MSNAALDRAGFVFRPRGVLWTPKTAITTANATELVAAVSDKTILVTFILYSNGTTSGQLMSIRWGATGTDYFPVKVPSDGGAVAINLIGSEACQGVMGDGLYGKMGTAASTAYISVAYMLV